MSDNTSRPSVFMPRLAPLNEPEKIADFLRAESVLRAEAVGAGIAPADVEAIAQAARELLNRPDRLADLVRVAVALARPEHWNPALWRDTPRDDSRGEQFFLLLPVLQRLAAMRAEYAARGMPDDVLRATLADIPIWIDTHQARTGRRGFHEIGWLREHIFCRVIRLGRLQFQPSTFNPPFVALVHRASGERCVVACGGLRFAESGVFANSEGAAGGVFETRLRVEAGDIREAHRVQANGRVAQAPSTFEPGAWEVRLAPGDPALAVHIPAGEPLDAEACRASFAMAAGFHSRHFPDRAAPRGLQCVSWLLYPGLADILPPSSNIVQFQRAFLRFPASGASADQAYERVFSPHKRNVARDHLTTSLQRRLFDHIEAGHVPQSTGGVVLDLKFEI
ncbi:MAG: acyltransferase domain-containing protein [Kiritimatiellia bacterium]|jgi:hypothetical protein